VAAVTAVLRVLIVRGSADAVGGEELVNRERDALEEFAGILAGAAAGRAVLIGHAVIEDGDKQLGIPLQADDRELAQGDKSSSVLVAHSEFAAEALAHAGGDFTHIAVAAAVCAGIHQLRVQHDRINGFHHCDRQIAAFEQLAVEGIDAHFGGEDFSAALAAEEDDAFIEDAQAFDLDGSGAGAVGVQGNAVEEAHIHGIEAPIKDDGLHIDIGIEQLGLTALNGLGAAEDILTRLSGVEAQVFDTVLIAAAVEDFSSMDTNGLTIILRTGNGAGSNAIRHNEPPIRNNVHRSMEGDRLQFSLCACGDEVKKRLYKFSVSSYNRGAGAEGTQGQEEREWRHMDLSAAV